MEPEPVKKGPKVLKWIGLLALIGILIAVGRIVLRVFLEKPDGGESSHEGV
jgi:LPS O-antigen subunit length determinant protein (WzzB/FepE family)